MAKAKVNPVVESEALTADETKQMDEMRTTDTSEPEPQDGEKLEKALPPEIEQKTEKEPKNTMVPHAALEEERQRRKATDKENQELKLQQARINERLSLINEALEKKNQPQVNEIPDPDKDALGAVKMTMEEVRQLKEFKERMENNQKVAQQVGEVGNIAANLEKQFIATNPDYNEASQHLVNSRRNELSAFGLSDQQINQQIMQESMQIAIQALQQGKNPAEIVYNLSKIRGYAKKEATQDTQAKLENIAAGQKANQSLGDVSGGSPNGAKIDAKSLATMSEADFAKVTKKLSQADMQELFGG